MLFSLLCKSTFSGPLLVLFFAVVAVEVVVFGLFLLLDFRHRDGVGALTYDMWHQQLNGR